MTNLQSDLNMKYPFPPHMSDSCDHNGGSIISKCGIKLTIPKGAIKEGDLVNFYIATSLYGPFILPSKCQADLASPYYWMGVTGSYHFHKAVQVEFEHFATVTACDPSHYQLLTCEDNDESYTMQLVDYDLNFKVKNGILHCTFETYHFCSYCLFHGCKDPMINRIAGLYLLPDDFQILTYFTVEVWFSLHISHCLETNKKYYEKKRMILNSSYIFESFCDINSTSFLTLNCDENTDGWDIDHSLSKKICTKKINFYNYFTNVADLRVSEEALLFPPRFIINVVKKLECTKDLSTSINVTLHEEGKSNESILFKLFVPLSASVIKRQNLLTIDPHFCNENKQEFKDLILYSKQISSEWK